VSVRESSDRYLSPEQAKRFYDRLGSRQDWQSFFENPGINEMIGHADFDSAHRVRVRVWDWRISYEAVTASSAR
jgi:hypothetical protein